MKFILSDHTKVIYYNTESKYTKLLHDKKGIYYGITWNENQDLTLAVGDYIDLIKLDHSPSQIKGFLDSSFVRSAILLSGPHQIIFHQDYYYVADTGRNRVCIFDKKLRFRKFFYATESEWDKVEGVQTGIHINSLFIKNNIIYVLAHNGDKPSFYQVYSLDKFTLLDQKELNAEWAHNICDVDDKLLICDSKNKRLIDGFTNQCLWKADKESSLTRGLCVTDKYIIVGRSSYIPTRINRLKQSSPAGVWVLDRYTFKELEYIEIPAADHVNGLRVLDEVDYAHNQITMSSSKFENEN